MDLYDYYYMKVRKEEKKTLGCLAREVGASSLTLSRIMAFRLYPDYRLCKKIQQISNGLVTVDEMMDSYYKNFEEIKKNTPPKPVAGAPLKKRGRKPALRDLKPITEQLEINFT